ncbi:hypothetical protein GCM10009836_10410 [Pseudonocardia ailaonensis]|uniref:RNA polymerase sigma-70 region 2 domain-containing protein n=1 Tax=Pseudonocardia ailaonensis TaxID=367279 RepID=A0ABN2MQC5_9PSEU
MSAQVEEGASVPAADPPPPRGPDGAASVVERDVPAGPEVTGGSLRADFGAHLETHYPRLVGQLFAITLDSSAAHDLVQDAYSRAWKRWSEVRQGNAEAWVRRVAVRSSTSPWRRFLVAVGLRNSAVPEQESLDPRTAGVLRSLARLPLPERRAAVLVHMAGMGVGEVAALERVSSGTVQARLNRVAGALSEGDLGTGGFAGYGWGAASPADLYPGYTGDDLVPVLPARVSVTGPAGPEPETDDGPGERAATGDGTTSRTTSQPSDDRPTRGDEEDR